ncbi:MAG TPA: major capsid protein, partial [Streptosporangiaceae bacterium]
GAADTVPWVWTETNDMAATGQPAGPDKLCFRVPCAAFTDTRLQCFGTCVTAGNLTASAWPELVADFITKLTAAQFHVNNATLIAAMVSGSTAVTGTSSATEANQGTYAPLAGNIELQAIDYRLKHGMCDNDVLEVVLPTWVRGMIRSDLAKRNGVDLLSVTDGQIAGFFNDRGVRVQYVQDWQIGVTGFLGLTTPATTWPDNVTFLIYAAGTWAKLQGLQLNLGVVRDSTLNSTNDYTAGWTEDCNTVVKIGHESRAVFVDVSATGVTAQQVDLTVAA